MEAPPQIDPAQDIGVSSPEDPELPSEHLADLIHEGGDQEIAEYVAELEAKVAARAVCELSDEDQNELLSRLSPEQASELLDDVPEAEAVEAVAILEPETAAAILEQLPSDEQADIVSALDEENAAAILAAMDPEDAEEIARLAAYPSDSAGGLMSTELLAFRRHATVDQVLDRLRRDAERFRKLDVQYAYVVEQKRRLVGVLRLRDLLLADGAARLETLMIPDPLSVVDTADIQELDELFEDHNFLGVPVVSSEGRLLGIVTRVAVDEQTQSQAEQDYRRSMGIVQEEIRAMPTLRRSRMRLSWLSVNILLNVVAASVIAGFQSTLEQVIALAVFLPIISDMSGCSGNQAVAVSMRELSLGLIQPSEFFRVWRKEGIVGIINGLCLGTLIGVVGWIYAGNPWLGLVVGAALACNTLLAVLIGGTLPLLLKRRGVDPALASGPILTTVTDMCGFFVVLSLATLLLGRLTTG